MSGGLTLSGLYQDVIIFFENFVSKKNWRAKLVLILTLLSLFLATGAYFYLPTAMQEENWLAFNQKTEHIFSQPDFEGKTHAAKKTFRLTVPLIAKIFHLGNYSVLILQFSTSIFFLFFSILLAEKITGDKVSGLLTATGLVFIYTGRAGFSDINTWFDEFAFLFLLLAMLTRKPIWIFILLQLACWTDERAVLSSGLVFIWWKLKEVNTSAFTLKSLFNFKWNSSVTLLSVIAYLVVRFMLSVTMDMHTPLAAVGFKMLLKGTDFMGFALWTSLEGFWILFVFSIIILWKQKGFFLEFVILSSVVILTLAAFSVSDKTRSISYMFPVIFICLFVLKQVLTLNEVRKILFLSSAICFLFPAYYVISDTTPFVFWQKPIFARFFVSLRKYFYGF